ncbi:alanine racemase [Halalkalibacter oceani]|uniref:Alanine racemase n=1 Tax=Halalkalibacter oceani TaxID=1653776 RepID=A0A9X2DTZ6_9BACI|nr:alanine racemase [Halalkalibacter oceani]MCM3716343.1 alanine racemase [Halalkalibacter oceani]MCM3761193.1 alanine racemase [Halalkalibacter oceani]
MRNMIDTPALVVDLDKMEAQLKRMANIAARKKLKLRPHTKTHKSPAIALQQLALGATGITVAKLGEAEVMRRHGIDDILIAYPLIGKKKLERLRELAKDTKVTVALDSVEVARGIAAVGEQLGRKIPVYLEVDTGLGRCGLQPSEEIVRLAEQVMKLSFLEITGVMTHSGTAYKVRTKEELQEVSRLEAEGLLSAQQMVDDKLGYKIPEVSAGSSPTAYDEQNFPGLTEMRPGTYVFNDATLASLGVVDEQDCALSVYTTIVSAPAADRVIIDAGSKTLTSDQGAFTKGFGRIKGEDHVWVSWLSEEHGVIELEEGHSWRIGDQIEVIPNHVCPTVNLADEVIGIRNGRIEKVFSIEARGKNK